MCKSHRIGTDAWVLRKERLETFLSQDQEGVKFSASHEEWQMSSGQMLPGQIVIVKNLQTSIGKIQINLYR